MPRAWKLIARPQGTPKKEDFALVESPAAPLGDGEFRVRNRWLSVDPYMRGRMSDAKSYAAPFELDKPMQGGSVGEVTESRNPEFAVGDLVFHMAGWREEAVLSKAWNPTKLPTTGLPDQIWLHSMGLTGGTAWFGLLDVAQARAGDVVFVSAAAGAVGSAVVQIAKARGMTVVGSAGGADKCAWVREIGADDCIDYKAGPVLEQLEAAAPEGIDVYFDNVGGDHLDAALALARPRARFAICGLIDSYNSLEPVALKYLKRIIAARIRIEGFLYPDYAARIGEFHAGMGELVAAGKVVARETIHEGIEAMPDAFLGLFSGGNVGKMLVRV